MSLDHLDRPASEPAETRPEDRAEEQPKVEDQAPDRVRPDPLKLFRASWERYKPAYEFLAGK